METAVQLAKDLVKCLCGIEFEVIENTNAATEKHLITALEKLLLEFPFFHAKAAMHQPLLPNCLYEVHTMIGIQYLFFSDNKNNRILLLGPSLMEHFSEAAVRQKLAHYAISAKDTDRLLNRLAGLPTLSIHLLHRTCLLLIHHLIGSNITVSHQVVDLWMDHKQPPQIQKQDEIPRMRQIETRYEISSTLTEAIKQGNLSLALNLLSDFQLGKTGDVRNANPLRNFQNYCIVLNTQLRHALENSGIHPYRLDRLSNEIGLEIENISSLESARDFVFLALQRYCRLVQENTYPNLKPLIHLAVTYIKEHLHEDLTVKETAHILGVNANYLSSQFHESMGLTFIDFVHRERTRQAAALLKHTNLQIQQIASTVGYNNTSYFAKQFLRFQKMSPSHYRKEGAL